MVGFVDLKRFDTPDEVRVFEKGRLAVVKVGGMTFARGRSSTCPPIRTTAGWWATGRTSRST